MRNVKIGQDIISFFFERMDHHGATTQDKVNFRNTYSDIYFFLLDGEISDALNLMKEIEEPLYLTRAELDAIINRMENLIGGE